MFSKFLPKKLSTARYFGFQLYFKFHYFQKMYSGAAKQRQKRGRDNSDMVYDDEPSEQQTLYMLVLKNQIPVADLASGEFLLNISVSRTSSDGTYRADLWLKV